MLRNEFTTLILKHTNDQQLAENLWNEIETAYTGNDRHFHNLSHLDQLFTELSPVKAQAEDWDVLTFAVFYHDLVYDIVQYVTENDNEDNSAERTEKALSLINFPVEKIRKCKQHILATKHHRKSGDIDTNFLIDADLSILGQQWNVYNQYMKGIRLEYSIYPDNIYNAGRIKVLRSFLQMDRIYKTGHFHDLYESTAKDNISRELEILSFA